MSASQITLNVLLVADASGNRGRLDPLAAALRTRGHNAVLCLDADAALAQPTPDVLVVDGGRCEDAAANLSITGAFAAPSSGMRTIAILAMEDFAACRDALRAGADDVFADGFSIDDVVASIEAHSLGLTVAYTEASHSLHRSFDTGSDGEESLCRELVAFATRVGLGRSHRFRIATAASEVARNASTHAYDGANGPLLLSAQFDAGNMLVEIRDLGDGFSQTDAQLDADSGCHGLDIVRGLAERVDIDSTNAGTKVTLEFTLTPTLFDEEPTSAEHLDYLTPTATRRFLEPAKASDGEFDSSALASTVGRILLASVSATSGRSQSALWS